MKRNNSGSGKKKWFKYVVEFRIHKSWIEDGGDIDNEDAHNMLVSRFPHAYNYELKAKVLEKPARKAIRKAQGYSH